MSVDPSIFKAYDVRGIYPTTLNEEIAYKIGQGYADFVKPKGEIAVGHDVRLHSEKLKNEVVRGLTDAGVNVVDVGLISTDMYYFAVGHYQLGGGIQSTASHNPPEWHGFKMVKESVKPLTFEQGITQIRDFAASGKSIKAPSKGNLRKTNIEEDYASFVLGWLAPDKIKPMKVVINANFGYAGLIFKKIVQKGKLPLEIVELNTIPDGTFPKGRPDPFVPENRTEFTELVGSTESDLGIAWDADADRVFFAADGGLFVEPYYLNTILIRKMLAKYPGEKVIYDPRYSWALIDEIEKNGGKPVISRVGHSFIKEAMRSENALFATESSGHTYYRDFWYADSGMIPVMQILEFLSEGNVKLSETVRPVMQKYFISGEINSAVADKEAKMAEIGQKYKDGKQSTLDGIAVEYEQYRFVVRPSNTEPLLRLTVEGKTRKIMEEKKEEILKLIRS
ncbi:phosphomannomutase/phosphoglucomutase [Candidatus Woesebacteria bacterium]|nr:phosphomannomutase/phosphoglucomutase [Candidatus Woesebacteria bacterium]